MEAVEETELAVVKVMCRHPSEWLFAPCMRRKPFDTRCYTLVYRMRVILYAVAGSYPPCG